MTEKQGQEMLEAARPLMKWLAENFHPHMGAEVTCTDVWLKEYVLHSLSEEFVRD